MKLLGELLNGKGFPSAFDSRSNYLGSEEGFDWFLVFSQNRDSDCLERSNFRSALRLLGGESDNVNVIRHGHWACGWIEYLIVNPKSEEVKIAEEIRKQY